MRTKDYITKHIEDEFTIMWALAVVTIMVSVIYMLAFFVILLADPTMHWLWVIVRFTLALSVPHFILYKVKAMESDY